jgi:hypothetical protein
MRIGSALIAAAAIAGCAAPIEGPQFQPIATPAADKATVYIYRPSREFNLAGYPEIFINGEKKFALLNNGYAVLQLVPGDYEIKAEGSRFGTNWWPRPTNRTIAVEAGREYYVRVVPALPPGVQPGPHLFRDDNVSRAVMTLVPRDQALNEISTTQLIRQ